MCKVYFMMTFVKWVWISQTIDWAHGQPPNIWSIFPKLSLYLLKLLIFNTWIVFISKIFLAVITLFTKNCKNSNYLLPNLLILFQISYMYSQDDFISMIRNKIPQFWWFVWQIFNIIHKCCWYFRHMIIIFHALKLLIIIFRWMYFWNIHAN